MKLVGEDLDDAVHKVGLGQGVSAGSYLLKDCGQDDGPVQVGGKGAPCCTVFAAAVQLGETDEVGSNKKTELVTLLLPPPAHGPRGLAIAGMVVGPPPS